MPTSRSRRLCLLRPATPGAPHRASSPAVELDVDRAAARAPRHASSPWAPLVILSATVEPDLDRAAAAAPRHASSLWSRIWSAEGRR